MRSPDEWWASESSSRKSQIQTWLDPEMRGRPHAEVPGQMPLVHIDQPKEKR